jgi:hypothetical protein
LEDGKRLYLKIEHPFGDKFSLNDKIYSWLQKDKEIVVNVAGRLQLISKGTRYLFCEQVKSKFPQGSPWRRYWYLIEPLADRQIRFSWGEGKEKNG